MRKAMTTEFCSGLHYTATCGSFLPFHVHESQREVGRSDHRVAAGSVVGAGGCRPGRLGLDHVSNLADDANVGNLGFVVYPYSSALIRGAAHNSHI